MTGSASRTPRREVIDHQLAVADRANASVVLLGELLEVLLDPEVPDEHVRRAVWQRATPEELEQALRLAAEIRRPLQDGHLAQIGERYHATRQFTPRALAALDLRANSEGQALLEAVDVLRDLNRRGARRVPDAASGGARTAYSARGSSRARATPTPGTATSSAAASSARWPSSS